jgi:hypothetical protein
MFFGFRQSSFGEHKSTMGVFNVQMCKPGNLVRNLDEFAEMRVQESFLESFLD